MLTVQDYGAILGMVIVVSGVIGWLFKVGHDRNIDAHDGIIAKVNDHASSAHAQVITLARIEVALTAMSEKLDKFERQYWQHRADHKGEE